MLTTSPRVPGSWRMAHSPQREMCPLAHSRCPESPPFLKVRQGSPGQTVRESVPQSGLLGVFSCVVQLYSPSKSPAHIWAANKGASEPWALGSAGRRAESPDCGSHVQLWNMVRCPDNSNLRVRLPGPWDKNRRRTPGASCPTAWRAQTHKFRKDKEAQLDSTTSEKWVGGGGERQRKRERIEREKRAEDRQRGGQKRLGTGLREPERDGVHSFVSSFILPLLNTCSVP